jgi:hypothetical protein
MSVQLPWSDPSTVDTADNEWSLATGGGLIPAQLTDPY